MKQFLVIFFLLLAIGTSIAGIFFFKDRLGHQGDSESHKPGQSYQETQENKEESMKRDAAFFNMAIEKRSKSNCEQIVDASKREECLATLIAIEAIAALDIDLCQKITDEAVKTSCIERVTEKKAKSATDKTLCDEIEGDAQVRCKNNIDEKRLQAILSGGAITEAMCNELEGTYKTLCQEALAKQSATQISSDAIKTGDASNCETITTENEKNLCYDTVNLKKALTTNNMSECDRILDTNKKTYCETVLTRAIEGVKYREYISSGDLAGCKNLTQDVLRTKCQETIIFATVRTSKDARLCSELTGSGQVAACQKLAQ